jgi:hypothetical protein
MSLIGVSHMNSMKLGSGSKFPDQARVKPTLIIQYTGPVATVAHAPEDREDPSRDDRSAITAEEPYKLISSVSFSTAPKHLRALQSPAGIGPTFSQAEVIRFRATRSRCFTG